jgi:hypothetical protein
MRLLPRLGFPYILAVAREARTKPDWNLLAAALAQPGLPPRERAVFGGMRARLKPGDVLTEKQRAWVVDVATRLGVRVGYREMTWGAVGAKFGIEIDPAYAEETTRPMTGRSLRQKEHDVRQR